MTREELIEKLEDCDGVVLADGFENALLGLAERCGSDTVAVYDYEKAVAILMERDGMTDEEANEWMGFNVLGAYVGEQTPWFLRRLP
jgi:hypothetical protein